MIRFSLYDFDKTIYSKDTGIEILIYLFFHYPKTWIYIPKIIWFIGLYCCKIIPMIRLKEIVFFPISTFSKDEWDRIISLFWTNNQKFLFPQVCNQIQKDKKEGYTIGILSASAEVLLYPVMDIIPADFLIGTIFGTTENHLTSKIIGKNCKKEEKVQRLYEYINSHYPKQEYIVEKMYSDSLHDLPLFQIAQKQFTIEKNGSIRSGLPTLNKNI